MATTSADRDAVRVHVGPEGDELVERAVADGGGRCVGLAEAEALVWTEASTERFPDRLPDGVRWVQLPSAGVEAWLTAGVLEREAAAFTSAAGAYGPTVAEHTLGLLLLGARELHHWVRQTSWRPHETGVLEGATVTVVGAGGIGASLFRLLEPLGTRGVAVTRSGRDVPGADISITAAELGAWWSETDYLVLAAPSNPATRHLVGRAELEALPDHAWIVNVGRGPVLDTEALVTALRSGVVRGAALDVTDPEPLPDGHPLWDLDAAVITPHVANPPAALRRRLAERVTENVRRFAAGDELIALVNPERGY